jgi:hypothetical protein
MDTTDDGTTDDGFVVVDDVTAEHSAGFIHSRESSADVSRKRSRHLGVAKDVVGLSEKGVSLGFGIARAATKFGFGIASACLQKPAEFLETASGENPVSTGLKRADSVLGFAQKVTHGCQDIAETITQASLGAAKTGLSAAGAEDNALLRMAVGNESTEAVTLVAAMVGRYTAEMADVPPQNLFAAGCAWGAMQRASLAVHGQEGDFTTLPEHCERWMRFAAATMGSAWFAGLVEGFSASALVRAQAVREQGGGPGDCALACAGLEGHIEVVKFEECTKEVYAPGYLVAVDRTLGCVVVALRGTSSVVDALTDLVCEPTPVQIGGHDGFAHGGMLCAAQRLDARLAQTVEDALSRLGPEVPQRLILCGHSLGAGVAALLATSWRDRAFLPGVNIQCIAFACPQVLDSSLAAAQSNHTTSIIVGDDMVPRFSFATAHDLQAAMLCLNNPESRGLPASLNTAEILEAQSQGAIERLATAYATMRPVVCTAAGRLFPAGRLVHLQSGQAPREISRDSLDELLISREMVSSHMPRQYLRAVQNAMTVPRL